MSSKDPAQLYLNDAQSDSLFYYATLPSGKINGLLVLLPGYFQKPESIFNETHLAKEAYGVGIATVIPTINGKLYLDSASKVFLNTVLQQVITTYTIAQDKVVIGGFSAGGLLALSANKSKKTTLVVPKAVFGVDCPTDLTNLWHRFTATIEKLFSTYGW